MVHRSLTKLKDCCVTGHRWLCGCVVQSRYNMWRWLAPKLPFRKVRDWAWGRKWRLWFRLYGSHVCLWATE